MKTIKIKVVKLLFVLGLMSSFGASARGVDQWIEDSKYEPNHQKLILSEIYQLCGIYGKARMVRSIVLEVNVDQMMKEYFYDSQLVLYRKVDQNIYDVFDISVQSERSIYGEYVVNKVVCRERSND